MVLSTTYTEKDKKRLQRPFPDANHVPSFFCVGIPPNNPLKASRKIQVALGEIIRMHNSEAHPMWESAIEFSPKQWAAQRLLNNFFAMCYEWYEEGFLNIRLQIAYSKFLNNHHHFSEYIGVRPLTGLVVNRPLMLAPPVTFSSPIDTSTSNADFAVVLPLNVETQSHIDPRQSCKQVNSQRLHHIASPTVLPTLLPVLATPPLPQSYWLSVSVLPLINLHQSDIG